MQNPEKPVVVAFCATFLSPEMLHVYRQVCGIQAFTLWVVTRTRRHPELFPFERLHLLKKSPWRLFSRLVHTWRGQRVPMSRYEVRQMHQLVERERAAAIHVYLGTEAVRVLPYLREERRPKIVSFHGADLSHSLEAAEFQQLLVHTDLFLVRSDSLRAALLDRGCPPERIRLNRTGVPVPAVFVPRTLEAIGPARPLRILQACRFINKKGLDVTLQAVARLRDRGVAVELHLAGSGPQEPDLRLLVGALNLESQVRFLGFLDNSTLLQRLPQYDLFVHPSRVTATGDQEGIPNALLEAMAWGVPTVSTRHSGIPEVVEHDQNGMLIDHADADLLATAMGDLVAQPARYAAISQAGHATIQARFTIAKCVESLEASYWYAMDRWGKRDHS